MTQYTKSTAKEWALDNLKGVCNVIMPSFRHDLSGLNEAAIRHDVRRNIELGFSGGLLVSEAGTTLDEMRRFMEVAVDEAAGRHQILIHGAFDTTADIIAMCKAAESAGVDAVLLGHPNSFYPRTAQDIIDYTSRICDAIGLAVVLFCAVHFNFQRVDPSGYPLAAIEHLVDNVPNVVGVKYEVGRPGAVGNFECFRRLAGKPVVVSDPFEANMPVWTDLFDMQWVGTSNYEYYGNSVPLMFELLKKGDREAALELYWRIQPARVMRANIQAEFGGANFIHRYLWKYQGWLNGYNGGPLRQPAMKLADGQMRRAAEGLIKSGIVDGQPADLGAYFRGRVAD